MNAKYRFCTLLAALCLAYDLIYKEPNDTKPTYLELIDMSPFFDASGNKILVLLSASVERFGVSHMQNFL